MPGILMLEDNRRINQDLSLVRNHLALTQQELKNVVGVQNVMTSRTDYMQRVNRRCMVLKISNSTMN